jgi:hypothetical protein
MSIFGTYEIPPNDIELEQKMKQFLDEALVAERFCNLDQLKTVALWYKEIRESKKRSNRQVLYPLFRCKQA